MVSVINTDALSSRCFLLRRADQSLCGVQFKLLTRLVFNIYHAQQSDHDYQLDNMCLSLNPALQTPLKLTE